MNRLSLSHTFLAALFLGCSKIGVADTPSHKSEIYSGTHQIDHVIKSMEGEPDYKPFSLERVSPPELLWVTAGDVKVLDAQTSAKEPSEMLCHSHMRFPLRNFDERELNARLGHMTNLNEKLFTMVQGQTEIRLPPGFGIPVLSNETFDFGSMIISPQLPARPLTVKAKGTFEFYRDSELPKPLKALFWRGLVLLVPVKMAMTGDICSPEMEGGDMVAAEPAKASLRLIHKNPSGRYDETYHWMVPPGRHEYHYTLKNGSEIPFDTTLHYANMHLHPYAESLELQDLTTGKSIYKGFSKNLKTGVGIDELTHFSSETGVPVYKDHQYELISVYNNTTDHDIDAMAILFVYLLDKDFDRTRIPITTPRREP